jgi:hypothetical protein
MGYPYRADECRDLTEAELTAELAQFGDPDQRAWLQEESPLFYWTWLYNLRRNCEHLGRPVPEWLESLLATAPPEANLAPPPVQFGAGEQ